MCRMADNQNFIMEWIQSFPLDSAKGCKCLSDLQSGSILLDVLESIFGMERNPNSSDTVLDLIRVTQSSFLLFLKREIMRYPLSYKGISSGHPEAMTEYIHLLFLAQVECSRSEEFLPLILGLTEPSKAYIAQVVESLREDSRLQYVDDLFGNEAAELRQHLVIERQMKEDLELELQSVKQNQNPAAGLEVLAQEKLNLEIKLAQVTDQLEASQHAKESLITSVEGLKEQILAMEDVEKSVQVYKQTIEMLEKKVASLTDSRKMHTDSLQESLQALRRENSDLKIKLDEERALHTSLQEEAENREKELGQFVMTGGALGGELRDKVIKTLQEQLALREEELEFFRSRDLETQEEQRKGERLLVSAIHAIALKYHEEMVASFEQAPCEEERDENNEDTMNPPDPQSCSEVVDAELIHE